MELDYRKMESGEGGAKQFHDYWPNPDGSVGGWFMAQSLNEALLAAEELYPGATVTIQEIFMNVRVHIEPAVS